MALIILSSLGIVIVFLFFCSPGEFLLVSLGAVPSLSCSYPKFLLPLTLKFQLFPKINNQMLIAIVFTVREGLLPFYRQFLTCKIIAKGIPQAYTIRKGKRGLPAKDLLL